MNSVLLILAGVLVHVVFFASIFDMYFTTPLVHGMTPHSVDRHPAPAKRLVLFVADGLRADKFYELDENGEIRAPFLRGKILQGGSWGVAHTRVPTESRPGHVALIAGFYEDVSAIAKGWKENPVEFDSVFNQSSYTWSWGSPDILPMFAKGATGDHVFTSMYPPETEDFGDDASKLDTWVFDKVQEFFEEARRNKTLSKRLSGDKIFFFFHLLGLDTNGHAHNPTSDEYLRNIAVVDAGIERMVRLIDSFYGHDQRTAYIFSSDHGMTDWGSHGAGHPHETLTPLVAWGAGIKVAEAVDINLDHSFADSFQKDWELAGVRRRDVSQADIAPLMASLVGVPFPLNSVGVLPLGYLNNTELYLAEALLANALQIYAQFEVKEKHMRDTTLSLTFRPFKKLPESVKVATFRDIRAAILHNNHDHSITLTRNFIKVILEGLNYYQTYDRLFIGVNVTLSFFAWMTYMLQIIVKDYTSILRHTPADGELSVLQKRSDSIFPIIGLIIILILLVQHSPLTYFVYCLLPVTLWYSVSKKCYILQSAIAYLSVNQLYLKLIGWSLLGGVALEILVLSFFYRELLSLGLVIMALWAITSSHLRNANRVVLAGWVLSCGMVAIFPFLPVVGRVANSNLVNLAGCLGLALAGACALHLSNSSRGQLQDRPTQLVTALQMLALALALYLVNSTAASLQGRAGLPLFNQLASWGLLVGTCFLPSLTSRRLLSRLLNSALALMAPYLLMAITHEGLFYLALCFLMYFWLQLEHKLSQNSTKVEDLSFADSDSLEKAPPRNLLPEDVCCAYFFVYFIITAFFGTGNIASINSFEPASVYCFLTIFSPFVMGSLLLIKVVIPFVLVTCAFNAIHVILRVPTRGLFMIVMIISDLMALHFFYLVRDTGSWLDIGTSISHYVIVMSMIIFLMILLAVARLLTDVSLPGSTRANKIHFQ